jgi:hypothetical protein
MNEKLAALQVELNIAYNGHPGPLPPGFSFAAWGEGPKRRQQRDLSHIRDYGPYNASMGTYLQTKNPRGGW